MADDYGSKFSDAYNFPLNVNGSGRSTGEISGKIENTGDEDWFIISLLKGAKYKFTLTGGDTTSELNDAKIYWYLPDGEDYIDYWIWDHDYSNYNDYNGEYTSDPVDSTEDYLLRVDLDEHRPTDAGTYTLRVAQLTPGTPESITTPPETTTNNNTIINNNITNNTTTNITNNGNGNINTGNIGTVENTTNVQNTFSIQTITINLANAITGDSKRDETVKGTTGDDLIAGGAGKDELIGNDGADNFYFSGEEPYTKKSADRVLDFDASEGDAILIDKEVVSNPAITAKVIDNLADTIATEIPVAENNKQLKQLSDDGHSFIYNERKGELLLDDNGEDKGFADKDTDPLIANLGKKTELTDALIDDVLDDLEADPILAIAQSKKELKSLAKDDYDLIYFEPKGDLYVDGNGTNNGFGKKADGGLIADLPNNSTFSVDNLLIAD